MTPVAICVTALYLSSLLSLMCFILNIGQVHFLGQDVNAHVIVVITAGGLHLAKSCGGCDGRGSSLRAEAVGMLSVSIFIVVMANHRKRIDIKIVYVSDNLQLINTSKEHVNYTDPYPNKTLSS